MATVTASKKKLVYKQGADGVFRLKKVDENESKSNKGVGDYLNELIGCAYEVQPEHGDKSVGFAEAPKPPHPRHVNPTANPTKRARSRRVPLPTSSTHSSDSAASTPMVDIHSRLGLRFHVPSFLLGAGLAGLVVGMWPVLSHYAVAFLSFAKLGVLWGIVLGGICWYCGLIKIQDASTLRGVFAHLSARMRPLPVTIEADPVAYDAEDVLSIDSDVSPEDIAALSGPPQQTRRNTLTRVTPFKYSSPREKYSSNPDLSERTSPPKLVRGATTDPRQFDRRNSGGPGMTRARQDLLDLVRPRTNTSFELADSGGSNRMKNLPLVSDDLPFINEIKLMSHDDMEQGDLRRLDTLMSKKSILGTRENYNRFVANVQDHEFD